MFGYTKGRKSDTQGGWTGSPRLKRAFNYGQEANIRCFVAKSVLSQFTHFLVSNFELEMSAGVKKLTNIRYVCDVCELRVIYS